MRLSVLPLLALMALPVQAQPANNFDPEPNGAEHVELDEP